jgi:signal transduction histidine kinase
MTSIRAPSRIIPRVFPGIQPAEIEEMISLSRVRSYPAGTVLCHEDCLEHTFYMLLGGDVQVTKDINKSQLRHLQNLTAGDFFGEMALIHNAPRAATVTATTDVVVLELDKDAFNRILQHSPSVAMAMVRVISSRLRQNDQIAVEDLRVRASELAEAYQKLAEQDLARREFLSNVAHELRTPLMAAHGYLQLLEKGAFSGEGLEKAISATSRNVAQIASLVNDILFLQEMELVLPDFRPVHLEQVAQNVLASRKERAEAGHIRFRSRQDSQLPPVTGDAASLERALAALVDNAIKFSPYGGEIEIRLLRHEDTVIAAVTDQGIGIDPDVKPHIFDRFFHLEKNGERLFGGLGLGLSIAQQVIEQHHGRLDVDSLPGRGSTFRITLPIWKK